METVCPTVRPVPAVTPSKFVLGDAVDNCTLMGMVRLKKGGNDCIVNIVEDPVLATVPVTRVNRK